MLNESNNEDFIKNFLHLKSMDSYVGEVGGVFHEDQYPDVG
jgi:hypothetical protein